jgi:hypothetical protein
VYLAGNLFDGSELLRRSGIIISITFAAFQSRRALRQLPSRYFMSTSTAANGTAAPSATSSESKAKLRDAGKPSVGGNPAVDFAGHAAQMRAALLSGVTKADMAAIAEQLVLRAREGNLSAIKLLLRYILHEPTPVKQPLPQPPPVSMPRSAPASIPPSAPVAERLSAEALDEGLRRLEFGLVGNDTARSPFRLGGGMAPSPNGKSQADSRRSTTEKTAGSGHGQPAKASCNARPAIPPVS